MKKNFVIPLIASIVMGFVSAQIIYSQYLKNIEKNKYNGYLIQAGVYTTKESLDDACEDLDKYLVVEEAGKYYLYLGITSDSMNANKIKTMYANNEVDVYIKPTIIDNVEFISNLEQYDVLINGVEGFEDIKSISETALSEYQEMVLGK